MNSVTTDLEQLSVDIGLETSRPKRIVVKPKRYKKISEEELDVKPKPQRFVRMTEEELDELAAKKHAEGTKFMTSWAVNTLKGKKIRIN